MYLFSDTGDALHFLPIYIYIYIDIKRERERLVVVQLKTLIIVCGSSFFFLFLLSSIFAAHRTETMRTIKGASCVISL